MDEKEAIEKFVDLEFEIQKRYKPLDWLDLTLFVEEGKGSITFGNNAKRQANLTFFNECRQIKEFIESKGYPAELILCPAEDECPYPEATINFSLDGSELQVIKMHGNVDKTKWELAQEIDHKIEEFFAELQEEYNIVINWNNANWDFEQR